MALCGFPFLAGFYSKDLVLESSLFFESNLFLTFVLLVSTVFTVRYSVRLSFFSIFGGLKNFVFVSGGDNVRSVIFPLAILGMGAVVRGSVFFSLFFCYSSSFVLTCEGDKVSIMIVLVLGIVFGGILFILEKVVRKQQKAEAFFR